MPPPPVQQAEAEDPHVATNSFFGAWGGTFGAALQSFGSLVTTPASTASVAPPPDSGAPSRAYAAAKKCRRGQSNAE